MADLLTRAYRRLGRHYITTVIVLAAGQVMGIAFPVVVLVAARVYDSSASTTRLVVGVGELGLVLAVTGTVILRRRELQTIYAWAGGEETTERATEVLSIAPHLARRFTVTAVLLASVCCVVPAETVFLVRQHLAAYAALPLTVGAGFLILAAAVLAWLLVELSFAPLIAHATRMTQTGSVPTGARVGLTVKMGLGIAAVTLGGEQLVAAIVLPAGSGTAGILHAFWATVAVSAFLLATSVLVLAFIVLRPIRALTRATQAVANDDLDVMVPVTSTDELAELTTSFNKMVEGLRERAALREDLRASRERIVAAADASRREVERDLHDGAQQHLVMVRLKLGLLAKDVEGDDRLAARVGALRQDLDKALDELRRLARGLYPPQLEEAGLAAALHEAAAMSAIPTRVEPDGVGRYGRELEAAVYFCCIEAMQNAAKHAGDGASVTVRLGEHDGLLEFEVSDDGRGYDVAAVTAGSGVQNIVDRVGALGGVVAMRTAPGAGTTVKAAIPVRAEHPVVAG